MPLPTLNEWLAPEGDEEAVPTSSAPPPVDLPAVSEWLTEEPSAGAAPPEVTTAVAPPVEVTTIPAQAGALLPVNIADDPLSQGVVAESSTMAPPPEEQPLGGWLAQRVGEEAQKFPTNMRVPFSEPGQMFAPQSLGGIILGYAGPKVAALSGRTPAGRAAKVGLAVGSAILGGGLGRGWEELGKASDEQLSGKDLLLAMGKGGLVEGTGELGGQGIGLGLSALAQKVLAPYAKMFPPSTKAIEETAKELKVSLYGPQLTRAPGASMLLRGIESRFGGHFPGYAKFQTQRMGKGAENLIETITPGYKALRDQAKQQMQDGYTKKVVGVQEAFGGQVKVGAEQLQKATKNYSQQLFNKVDKIMDPHIQHPLSRLGDMADTVVREENALKGLPRPLGTGGPAALPVGATAGSEVSPQSSITNFIKHYNIGGKDMTRNFPALRELQSQLSDMSVNLPVASQRRQAARLASAIGDDLREIAKTNPGAGQPLTDAVDYYQHQVIDRFLKNENFQNILEKDASQIADVLLNPKTTVEQFRRLEKVVPVKDINKVTAGMLSKVYDNSLDEAGQWSLNAWLRNMGQYPDSTLHAALGPERFKTFTKMRDLFVRVQSSGIGAGNEALLLSKLPPQLSEQLVKAGADTGSKMLMAAKAWAAGYNPLVAVGLLSMGKMGFSKMLFSEKAGRFFREGIILKPGQKDMIANTGRTLARIGAAATVDWPEGWTGGGIEEKASPRMLPLPIASAPVVGPLMRHAFGAGSSTATPPAASGR